MVRPDSGWADKLFWPGIEKPTPTSHHLKMMRVTVIEDPKPSQPKVNFKVGGEWCTCYVQGNAWEPGCEELYTRWSPPPKHGAGHILKIKDDTLPWHGCVYYHGCVRDGKPEVWIEEKYPHGLWVASRLASKRTRNPKCFRGIRYFVAWKPGSKPPFEELHEITYLLSPPSPVAPDASEVPLPFGLASL